MKAWLKGGVIALVILVVLYLIALIFLISYPGGCKFDGARLSLPVCIYMTGGFLLFPTFLSAIPIFLIGMFIGWLVGKIKSKK